MDFGSLRCAFHIACWFAKLPAQDMLRMHGAEHGQRERLSVVQLLVQFLESLKLGNYLGLHTPCIHGICLYVYMSIII